VLIALTDEFENIDVYNVVTEPARYDAFMRALLDKVDLTENSKKNDRLSVSDIHWDKASKLLNKVTPWRSEKESDLDKFLASKIQAMLAVGADGKIVAANNAARGLYNLTHGSSLNNLPLSPEDYGRLKDSVQRIIEGNGERNNPNNVLRFQNSKTKKPLLLTLVKRLNNADGNIHAVIMTNDLHWPPHLGPILTDLFQLTQAEIEIIRLMVFGTDVNEMAQKRSTLVSTIRSQLRSIFGKTDTGSQIECLRTVLGLAMMHEPSEGKRVAAQVQAGIESTHYPRDDQRKLFQLKNGRQIDYSVFGAATGPKRKGVVLFYHDQALGDTWFKEAVKEAARAGVQIIAPLRPGFGRTSLYEGDASDPKLFAPEIKELLDHLKIKKAALMTLRSGLVHGLAAAEFMPRRFTSITAANPILPVTCDADLEGTNGYNKLIPKTRLHFPHALRFLCKAGFAFVTAKGPEAFATAVVRDSPKDFAWVSRPEILSVIVAGLPVHRHHGYRGNYGDIAYAEDWRPLLRASKLPIRLVIGEDDRNVQWSAARYWADTLDNVDLHILPESGYMVQHQQPAQFLEWLTADLKI